MTHRNQAGQIRVPQLGMLMEQVAQLSPQQLEQAFQIFNSASTELCSSYEQLRQQAEVLTQELALANGELRRQFAEKEALREAAQRSERLAAMGEMSARLAHQLRTPLATALLYAAQLGNAALPAGERARFAEKTVERLRHLERLIDDMLQFVRGVSADCVAVSASELLQTVFDTLHPQALARGLLVEMADGSDGRAVQADRLALTGALLSLAENALQACADGGRVVLGASAKGDELVFSVKDTGSGMTAAVQARLFEPFFTTRSGGSGLGLAIVRAVSEAHGGSVTVRSAPGAGSEFLLRLPLASQALAALEGA